MKNKIIIWGTDNNAKSAWYKLKEEHSIDCCVIDDGNTDNRFCSDIPCISVSELSGLKLDNIDFVICDYKYGDVAQYLFKMGIFDYYVMLEGFLYHTSLDETMIPIEINSFSQIVNEKKRVLIVDDVPDSHTYELAQMAYDSGDDVRILYTLYCENEKTHDESKIDNICFTTVNGIRDYIGSGSFNRVICASDSPIVKCICSLSFNNVEYDRIDNDYIDYNGNMESIVLNYLVCLNNQKSHKTIQNGN